ncbi:unnamed protein product [Linum trigynum]|uniref:Uncharacterized protein n=1 Tax=Linum trigynum TaxID=586398 RepID=A0AAV2FJU6_9ROSI
MLSIHTNLSTHLPPPDPDYHPQTRPEPTTHVPAPHTASPEYSPHAGHDQTPPNSNSSKVMPRIEEYVSGW